MGRRWLVLLICALPCGVAARADTTYSYTGTLLSPYNNAGTFDSTDSFLTTVTLATTGNVTLQTYGFGGGTNAANVAISPGGTDPFVALFSGTGDGAVFLNGGSLVSNYMSGCPPANTVSNFGDTTCGDETLSFSGLAAGTYTVLLSDGQYLPCPAVSLGCSALGDGAFDFTGGVFCNADDVDTGTPCPNASGAWALDVTVSSAVVAAATPEPGSLMLLGTGVSGLAALWRRRRSARGIPAAEQRS